MAATNYTESGVLNHIFRTSTFSKPSTIAIALLSTPANDTLTGVTMDEVANAGSYARVDLGSPADADWDFMDQVSGSGHIQNTAAITFPSATAAWGAVSGVAIVDSATFGAGNLLYHASLDTVRTVENTDTFEFAIGSIDIYLS